MRPWRRGTQGNAQLGETRRTRAGSRCRRARAEDPALRTAPVRGRDEPADAASRGVRRAGRALRHLPAPPRCRVRRCDARHGACADRGGVDDRAERGEADRRVPPVGHDARAAPSRVHRDHRGLRHRRLPRDVQRHGRPPQPHSRDLSTATSGHGSKPCSTSQRTASRLRNDHHARITSRSTSVP